MTSKTDAKAASHKIGRRAGARRTREPSGYRHCACRDCFGIIVGVAGDFCDACREAGCPDYQGQAGMSQECQREDAYDSADRDA